ncbi:MAG TPA: 50S ribosomal protein L32e [Candidatus Acidoferrum sp.]|nr:50S ribosomal protein L32e [Candidatus Acidoferrum sp.]
MTEPSTITPEKALRIRKRVKDKKPSFVRPESWRYVRIKESWRSPKGLDHKMRIEYKGWPAPVKVGYRGPRIARGLHPSGFKEVLVHNVDELKEIDVKTQAARIAHTVGRRKKAKILAEAKKRKIIILNLKEIKKPPEQEKEELAEEKEEETVKTEEAPTEEKEVEESKPEKTRKRKRRTEKQ